MTGPAAPPAGGPTLHHQMADDADADGAPHALSRVSSRVSSGPARWAARVLDRAAAAEERADHAEPAGSLRDRVERAELRLIADAPAGTDWDAVARAHERLLASALEADARGRLRAQPRRGRDRRTRGVFYTPPGIVRHLLDQVGRVLDAAPRAVADPACGAGGVLTAAGDRWPDARLVGIDTDPVAAAIARRRLTAAALLEADALSLDRDGVRSRSGDPLGFDLVAGNPPFRGQLAAATASSRDRAAALADRTNGLVRGYADTAAAFLLEALALARPGGVVAMVMPMSLLGARDAAPVRAHLAERHTVEHLWVSREPAFDGGVRVCAVVVRRGDRVSPASAPITSAPIAPDPATTDLTQTSPAASPPPRARGRARLTRSAGLPPCFLPDTAGPGGPEPGRPWGPLVADAWSIPRVDLTGPRSLGDLAEVAADFRDEYYALRGRLREAPDTAGADRIAPRHEPPGGGGETALVPVITAGLIDPARCLWGLRPATLHRARWQRPAVDPAGLTTAARAWAARRLVPKLLVATQSRVFEAAADPAGALLPVTPVLSVVPRDRAELWSLGAVLTSPATAAHAAALALGTSLSGDAIKCSAAQLRRLPVPPRGPALDRAASAYRAACEAPDARARGRALRRCAAFALHAQGLARHREALLGWWAARLPRRTESKGTPRP